MELLIRAKFGHQVAIRLDESSLEAKLILFFNWLQNSPWTCSILPHMDTFCESAIDLQTDPITA